MKIKDIIKNVDRMLSLKLPAVLFDENANSAELQNELNTDGVRKLVDCCNFVLDELQSDYAPLYKTQSVTVNNYCLDYSQLNCTLCEVYSLKDEGGNNVNYYYGEDGIVTNANGKMNITYSVKASDKGFSDNVEVGLTAIGARTLAYGVAAEYCLLNADYDEMTIWDNRYKSALQIALRKKSEKRIPKRKWY